MEVEWWWWLVLGIGLILMELVTLSFYLIWFGGGALVVAAISAIYPQIGLVPLVGVWAALSALMAATWIKYFPRKDKTRAGTSDEALGEVGLLVTSVQPFERGSVRFQRPILGSDVWDCVSETAIEAGERVRLVSVEGSFLKVANAKEL